MYFLHSWYSSLKLFKPSNLKLFSLVLIKLLMAHYKTYFKYSIIPIIYLLVVKAQGIGGAIQKGESIFLYMAYPPQIVTLRVIWWEISLILYYILRFILLQIFSIGVFLLMRVSVDRKDFNYFVAYIKYYVVSYAMLLFLYAFSIMLSIGIFFKRLLLYFHSESITSFVGKGIVQEHSVYICAIVLAFNIHFIIALFFLAQLESKIINVLRAFWLSLKFIFYNLPFFIVCELGLFFIIWYLQLLQGVSYIFLPVLYGIFALYYTKKIHEQPFLYMDSYNE